MHNCYLIDKEFKWDSGIHNDSSHRFMKSSLAMDNP